MRAHLHFLMRFSFHSLSFSRSIHALLFTLDHTLSSIMAYIEHATYLLIASKYIRILYYHFYHVKYYLLYFHESMSSHVICGVSLFFLFHLYYHILPCIVRAHLHGSYSLIPFRLTTPFRHSYFHLFVMCLRVLGVQLSLVIDIVL